MTVDGRLYAVDFFGMDDGHLKRPDGAFRFIFQLGAGAEMYLYVIQAGMLGSARHFFHTFWFKGMVAVDMEMEEWGAPGTVACAPIDLPLLYESVVVGDDSFVLEKQTFWADGEELTMRFELRGREPLVWTRSTGWPDDTLVVLGPLADSA